MRHALVAVAVLTGCYHDAPGAPPAQNAARPPSYAATIADPLGFLPIDSELVMSLDARAVRASSLWPLVEPKLLAAAEGKVALFAQRCGVDPIASITRVAVGIRGLGGTRPSGVFVIHGLDRAKIMDCAHRAVARPNPDGSIVGDTIVIHPTPSDPRGIVIRFVGERTCVLLVADGADERSLDAVLAAGAPLRGSPTFSALFERVDTHQALWLVLNGNSKVFDSLASLGVKPRAVWGWFALHGGIVTTLHVQLDTAAEAQQLAQTAQGQLGIIKPMVDAIDLTAEDADIVVTLSISDQKLQSLIGLIGGAMTP